MEPIPEETGTDETGAETRKRRRLEARRRLTAEELVAGGDRGNEAEDRRNACRCGSALEETRTAEEQRVDRSPRDEDSDRTEDRADLHDPMVPDPIGEHAKRRREDQLRGEERRREQ